MLWFGHMLKLKSVESGPFKKQKNKKTCIIYKHKKFFVTEI